MSFKDGRDFIYLIWKDPKSRRQFIIGHLSKNGQFEFEYGFEVEKAIKAGFELLIGFENINEIYKSDILFPVFSSRLPDKKRRGIETILSKYNMEKYDEYKLLKRSGARLPIDSLEFIDPIMMNDDIRDVTRIFYLAGPRHYIGCNGEECAKSIDIEKYEALKLVLESENDYDNNAIKICNSKGLHIGYLPRYYSPEVTELLKRGYNYSCRVYEVFKENNCNECIKVEMIIQEN